MSKRIEEGAASPDEGPSEELQKAAAAMEAQDPPEQNPERLKELSKKITLLGRIKNNMGSHRGEAFMLFEPDQTAAVKDALADVKRRDAEAKDHHEKDLANLSSTESTFIPTKELAELERRRGRMESVEKTLGKHNYSGLSPREYDFKWLEEFLQEQEDYIRAQIDASKGKSEGKE